MKHIFIINPSAGPKNSKEIVEAALAKVTTEENIEVYTTKCPGDATAYVKRICSQSDEHIRFYACGGDGTLNEVVNGAADFSNAAVGCFPCGSGNDFVKCYGGVNGFLNIDDQINGTEQDLDLILVNGKYCVNVCNFGFDANVLVYMESLKNKLFFRGKLAYIAGILKAFTKSMRSSCKVVVDGEQISDGEMLLCTIANGEYIGSSFRCAPKAVLDDGLLEFCYVKTMSRLRFISMIGSYVNGEHLDNPKYADIIIYRRCKKIEVIAQNDDFPYALDGEVIKDKQFAAEVVTRKLKFVIPVGVERTATYKETANVM